VQKLAAQNMDYVRLELEYNPRVTADYGTPEVTGSQTVWTVRLPKRRGTTKFEAFGIGMSPRGRRHGEFRPLEFVGDDLEDAELARNPEREQNLWDWMMDEVLPALEPGRCAFTVLGTMFGPHCMVERARKLAARRDAAGRPLARVFVQKVMEDGRSVWPERFSDEVLSRIRATIGLRNWLRNYALEPDDPTKPFQANWMGTYRAEEVDAARLDVVAFLDPAISRSSSGCPRALIAVGADRTTGVRYVLDAWIDRGSPAQMLEKLFEFGRRLRPRVMGVEANGGYALIRPLLEVWETQRGVRLPVRYVHHKRPKDIRIETLCSQFESGRWMFPQNPGPGVRMLQEQFLSYPDGFVDGPDAAAGCDELLPDAFVGHRPAAAYRSLGRRTDFGSL
jgi:predicted phage terminase large subunit-like protein